MCRRCHVFRRQRGLHRLSRHRLHLSEGALIPVWMPGLHTLSRRYSFCCKPRRHPSPSSPCTHLCLCRCHRRQDHQLRYWFRRRLELELELIQTHMAQKPLLWGEVGAHAVCKRSECGGVVWAGEGAAWRLCVVIEAFWAVWRRRLSLCGALLQGVACKAPLTSGWVV
jgi:hypothetical protein